MFAVTMATSLKCLPLRMLHIFGVVLGTLFFILIYGHTRNAFTRTFHGFAQLLQGSKTPSSDLPLCSIQTALKPSQWDEFPPPAFKDECAETNRPRPVPKGLQNYSGNGNREPVYNLAKLPEVPFYTDVPRNQTTINFTAKDWTNGLTKYRNNGTPTDALWMPITPVPWSCERDTKWLTNGTRSNKRQNNHSDIVGFVYSAYLDTRFPQGRLGVFVRVLGVLRKQVCRLSCRFNYQQPAERQDQTLRGTREEGMEDSFVEAEFEWQWLHAYAASIRPFREVFINCPLPKLGIWLVPVSVSVFYHPTAASKNESGCSPTPGPPGNMLRVIARSGGVNPDKPAAFFSSWEVDKKPSFSFCVRNLRDNYKDVVQLVEFIEFHAILGVTDFYMYGHTYTKQVECTLQKYYKQDIFRNRTKAKVHFLNYELPLFSASEVHQAGPATTMNDCLYRSMAKGSHYVANGDLDEIFLPVALKGRGALYETMYGLSQHDPNAGSFEFSRFQAWRDYPDDESYKGPIRLRTMRKTRKHEKPVLPKLVVLPERVTGFLPHWVRPGGLMPYHHQCGVNDVRVAYVNHYRLPSLPSEDVKKADESNRLVDRTAHAYSDLLNEEIRMFLAKVPKECNVTEELWQADTP